MYVINEYKSNKAVKLLLISLTLLCLGITNALAQDIYWVTKSGSDDNNCTNITDDACLTIQKGISVLTPGDTLNVSAGIYADDGGTSPYIPTGTFVGWSDNVPPSSNIVFTTNGELDNLITVRATPGDEGLVTIDGENQRIAIHLQNTDYIRISGFNIINSRTRAIASWGKSNDPLVDPERISTGVIIENNKMINTIGEYGRNTNIISMWGSQDWIVRNNYLDNVYEVDAGTTNFRRMGTAIMAYGVINALIENNEIRNAGAGIFWKDHYITDLATRGKYFESEIRYNKIIVDSKPVYIGIRAGDSAEAGDNYIHHNILYKDKLNDSGGINVEMAGAFAQSGDVRIEHNLIDGVNITNSRGIKVDASRNITVKGNIIIRARTNARYTTWSAATDLGKKPVLNYSDYNVYHSSNSIISVDAYGLSSQGFATLPPWQAALASQFVTLNFDNPDTNSITVNPADLFDNLGDKNYIYKVGSPAIDMMPDGTNAGPYQFGGETIGLLPQWPSGAVPIFTDGFE